MDSMMDIGLHMTHRASIHPTAIVAQGADIGPGVDIGPFCTVGPNVVIEAGAKLLSHVVVEGHTRIGEGAQLFPFCTVGLAPQDMKYKDEPTRCEIGPRTLVREHCHHPPRHSDRRRRDPRGRRLHADGRGPRRA